MRSAVAIVVLCTTACGMTMTNKPDPRQPRTERPRCTESMRGPKQDLIGVAVGLVLVLYGTISLDTAGNEALATPLLAGGSLTMGASLASAGVGRARVKKCRKAIAAHEQHATAVPPPPPPPPALPPPEPPATEAPPLTGPFGEP